MIMLMVSLVFVTMVLLEVSLKFQIYSSYKDAYQTAWRNYCCVGEANVGLRFERPV